MIIIFSNAVAKYRSKNQFKKFI